MRSATDRGAAVNNPHFQVWQATENFEIPPMPVAQALFESQALPIPCVPREVPVAMFFPPAARGASGSR